MRLGELSFQASEPRVDCPSAGRSPPANPAPHPAWMPKLPTIAPTPSLPVSLHRERRSPGQCCADTGTGPQAQARTDKPGWAPGGGRSHWHRLPCFAASPGAHWQRHLDTQGRLGA
jgi:hypothetical protein